MNKEALKRIVQTKKFAVVVASVLSAAGGGATGYILAQKRLEAKYAELSEREIREAKVYYDQKYKEGEFADPSVLAEKYDEDDEDGGEPETSTQGEMIKEAADILEHQQYVSYDRPEQTVEEVVEVKQSIKRNIFEDERALVTDITDREFDLDDELDKKAAGKPYIIEQEQFFENDSGFSQTTLTWFEGDQVLVDEHDQPIREVDRVIGLENLRWGCGTLGEKNVVYIANDKLNAEYEVTRSFGSYTEEVLGFFQPKERNTPRKFRDSD